MSGPSFNTNGDDASKFDTNGNTASDFDPNMFGNFDFSQPLSVEEQNVLNDIIADVDFNQAADSDLFETVPPAPQQSAGAVAPPPSPFEPNMAETPSRFFDGLESGPVCVFCSAPPNTYHHPDCARVWKYAPTSSTEDHPSGEDAFAPESVGKKLTPIAESSSPGLTVLDPAIAGRATSNSGSTPFPAREMAPPAYVSPYGPSPYGPSPYGPSPYPMPTAMVTPATAQPLTLGNTAPYLTLQHQAAIATVASSSSGDDDASLKYKQRFAGFDAARQALVPQGVDPLVKLGLTSDNWQQLKAHHIHSSATRLFDAFHAPAGPAPGNFTEDQTAYYKHHQGIQRQSVLNEINSNSRKAEARAMLLLEQVINVHEHGVPTSVYNRTAIKSGYLLETGMVCSERLEAVIHAVKNDKYVALDVLSGTGIADLTRSPARYLRRKHENCKVNARKAFEKAKAEELKRNGAPAGQTPAAPASRAAKKTPNGKQPIKTQGVSVSPLTPTPSLPTTQIPSSPVTHLQIAPATDPAPQQQKRKGKFTTAETLTRFKYMEGNQQ